MDPNFLTAIIAQSKPNAGPNSPHGFCYIPNAQLEGLKALHTGGMIEVGSQNHADMTWPVRPTEAAVKWDAEASAQSNATQVITQRQHIVQPHAQVVQSVEIEDNVPLPEKRAFGRTSDGTSLIDNYPFAQLNVGQSFFVPQDAGVGADKPKHRTFSSVVSQASKKFAPKYFMIREDNKNGVPGARVFRMEDVAAEDRQTRARKAKPADQPSGFGPGAAPGAPAGTTPIPGVDTFPAPAAGFAQPPAAFPGGFPAPGAPSFGTAAGGLGQAGFAAPPQPGWGAAPAADPALPGWSS